MEKLDVLNFLVLLVLLFSATATGSDIMGALSLIFSFGVIFKRLFSNNSKKLSLDLFEKAILVYFLLVTLSLFASSLFTLSLHGYIKTFIYILFFFCAGIFFQNNKDKITPTLLFIAALASYESIIAIMQNMSGVKEISGWQDMTRINPEQVVSRAYGTLQPYNPNLLAGYLLACLSSFIYLILNNLI